MKHVVGYGILIAIVLLSTLSLSAQNEGLTVNVTKLNQKSYTINSLGKREMAFEVTGIASPKQAENLLKHVRGFRGVEEFNLIRRQGTNIWDASGIFYEQADEFYFRNLFGIMDVTKIKINNVVSSFDNL